MTVLTTLRAGGALRVPMTYAEYQALGETKYAEFYDGMATVNPPTRRHVVLNRRLTLLLSQAVPAECEVLPDCRPGRSDAGYPSTRCRSLRAGCSVSR